MPWGTKINKGTRRRELAGVTDMTPKIDDIRDAVLKGFAAISDDEGGFSIEHRMIGTLCQNHIRTRGLLVGTSTRTHECDKLMNFPTSIFVKTHECIDAKLSSKGLGKFMQLQFPKLWKAVVDDPHADDPDELSWFLCLKSGKALRVLGGRENPNAGDLSESLVVVPWIGCSVEFVQKKTGMSHGLFLGQYMKGEEDSDDERPAGSRGCKRKSRVTSDEESSDDNSSGKRRVKKEGLFLKAPSDDELDREIEDGLSNSHNFKLRSSTKRSASQHLEKQEPNSPIDLTQEDDNVNGSDSGSTHFEKGIEQEELECSSSPVVPKPDAFAQLLGKNSYFSPYGTETRTCEICGILNGLASERTWKTAGFWRKVGDETSSLKKESMNGGGSRRLQASEESPRAMKLDISGNR
ncbi:hypothetical protein C8J56DRAFT_884220 [Mycena floridula]|nr:hypothetical protein C8J56DRAFT_884220 [Mycena floridula]